jgi:hypothetical protein
MSGSCFVAAARHGYYIGPPLHFGRKLDTRVRPRRVPLRGPEARE